MKFTVKIFAFLVSGRIAPPVPRPQGTSPAFNLRHIGGKCLFFDRQGFLSLTHGKCDIFLFSELQSIVNLENGLCMVPEVGSKNDSRIRLQNNCEDPNGKFQATSRGSIRNTITGFCLYPKSESLHLRRNQCCSKEQM